MATLADLQPGQAFILLARLTAQDQVTGDTLDFYGPDGQPRGTMTISPAGVFAGQLATTPDQIPIQLVPAFGAVSTGAVLQHTVTGETMVARRVRIEPDGSYQWSASLTGPVWYSLGDWAVAGQVSL